MISIIIPNRNGLDHLKLLMPSISAQTAGDFETVLVDNASSDSSVESARKLFPTLRTVELPANEGFAAACNRGAEAAAGEYLFFLNSDTILDPRCIAFCGAAIAAHSSAGFLQPKIVKMLSRDLIDRAGDSIPMDGRPVSVAAGKRASTPLPASPLFPSGAACIWKRAVFEKLGGYDPNFFAYLEDIDLGFRAALMNIKGIFITDAVVYHKGAGSAADAFFTTNAFDRPEVVRWIARNKIWLWARCLPASVLVACAPWMLVGFVKSAAFHTLRSGAGRDFFRGTLEGVAALPRALRERRRIQSERKISSREVLNWMKQTSQS